MARPFLREDGMLPNMKDRRIIVQDQFIIDGQRYSLSSLYCVFIQL